MKIIGSRAAAELARKKLGERAFAERHGKHFDIGERILTIGSIKIDHVLGRGKSWESALKDAGITIPVDAPYFPQEVVK